VIAQVHGGGILGSVTRRSVSHAFPSKESQRREGCERLLPHEGCLTLRLLCRLSCTLLCLSSSVIIFSPY
jgi:hypothetical protein